MALETEQDRYEKIIKGKVRKELKRLISRGYMVGKKGKDLIKIPVSGINMPRFRHNDRNGGGVSRGDGKKGDVVGRDGQPLKGRKAGDQPGDHYKEVEITLDELAKILGEELELPNIKPKGKKSITVAADRYTSIRKTGPEALRHPKRTFLEALKRQIAEGGYDKDNPVIMPIKEDKRYRSWKTVLQPYTNALIIYGIDSSGSMGEEAKEMARLTAFWIDTWLRSQYKKVERLYISHDAEAVEVDEETFYGRSSDGGTKISSFFALAEKRIKTSFNPSDWNIYIFYFSDGDNWGEGDNEECKEILERLLPNINQFAYGQVPGAYGSGDFLEHLQEWFTKRKNVVWAKIFKYNKIYFALKKFLGKGN